jgi:O-antigen/teichoic acid export membrane protein
MASVRRNILANVVERACSTVLTLLLVPIQVRILGIETFGLLASSPPFKTLFNVLDLGLGTTVTRGRCRHRSGPAREPRRRA